jgi:hypothetical protein
MCASMIGIGFACAASVALKRNVLRSIAIHSVVSHLRSGKWGTTGNPVLTDGHSFRVPPR